MIQNWCIKRALEWQWGRGNPFFIEMHCQLGCSECNSCDIKRKESQGESERSNRLKSDSGSSKIMLEKVALFAGLQLRVGLCGSQYAAGDKGVCMDPTYQWTHSNTPKVVSYIWPKNSAEQFGVKIWDHQLSPVLWLSYEKELKIGFSINEVIVMGN